MKKAVSFVLLSALTLPLNGETFVLFGTHKEGPGIGFSESRFNSETGALTAPQFLEEASHPTAFVASRDGRYIYTCNSIQTFEGLPGGAVSAYGIDPKTAHLTLLNQRPTSGGGPSYVSFDATGRYLFVANYHGGSIAAFALKPDGSIGERTAFIQHTGSSVNPQRQKHAFAHAIEIDPSNRFALVADLGLDKVFIYRFDQKDGSLRPNNPPSVTIAPGSGPRHLAFNPNGRFVYLINELSNNVVAFTWDSSRGALNELQTISTLPAGYVGAGSCAEIGVHRNGRFIYASNRGPDTVAVLAVDPLTGRLSLLQNVSTQGKMPKDFALDPTSHWLIVTNHGSDNATLFAIDGATGLLTAAAKPVSVPYPFGVRFVPVH